MLSPLDDYPVHQVAEVMRHVGTSDRNFYDRYYFNLFCPGEDLFVVAGMAQYPNLGVADAFVLASRGTDHRVVRSSRALGDDRMDTAVGPISVEIVEGLKRLRVVCAPAGDGEDDPAGIALDATFTGSIPATLEPRHVVRDHERLTFDTQRIAQTGRWSGTLRIADEHFDLDDSRWWGYRDRSWGIRPVGEAEPPGIRATGDDFTFFWCYTPLQFDDHSLLLITQEDRVGNHVLEAAQRVWADGRIERLGIPHPEVTYEPGTRAAASVRWHLTEPDGTALVVDVERQYPCYLLKGTGYGVDDDWRHGAWQGELVTQRLAWDLTDPEVRAGMFGLVENSARAIEHRAEGVVEGWGMLEFAAFGAHDRSGFTGWENLNLIAPDAP
jgi:hypothetical protein